MLYDYDANGSKVEARFDAFAPVMLDTTVLQQPMWAVPMLLTGMDELREFSFMVGDHMKRTFTNETLPEFLKDRLSILLPFAYTVRDLDLLLRNDAPAFWPLRAPAHYPRTFRDVGWYAGRGSEGEYYSVSMTWNELTTLRGEKHDA